MQASITMKLDSSRSAGEKAANVAAAPATIAPHVANSRRGPPTLILSRLSIDTISMLGSRLKPMRASQTPPAPESMTRLRRSAPRGSALRLAMRNARCGQANPWMARAAHASGWVPASWNAAATAMKPAARPSTRSG